MTSSALIRRIELLEHAVTTPRRPKLVFCWTRKLGERIQHALGLEYIPVSIRGIGGVTDDDELEKMIRQDNPAESERLDRLLQGIPPD
jgi:hypothetical protein